ncbi:MAG: phosphatidylcholine/phosphatidylserine synthase [Alphaproteobacteria bacterium]|nr:phosphatidylcholine/phosphatidylserine synthase [Alphaproteobacteria bacterium]
MKKKQIAASGKKGAKKHQTIFQQFYWPVIVPNSLTLLAICLGLSAIRTVSVDSNYPLAIIFIALAAVLDNLDGWVARRLKAVSPIGAQLDSLADFLNFAVTPSFIMYQFTLYELNLDLFTIKNTTIIFPLGWVVCLVFILAGAFRLARFNAMGPAAEKWKYFFQGVPTPAGAGLCLAPLVMFLTNSESLSLSSWIIAIWVVIVALLMISSIPTYSTKGLAVKKSHRPVMVLVAAGLIYSAIIYSWATLLSILFIYTVSLFISPYHFWSLTKKSK